APEKMFVLDYAHFMPPTLVARKLADVRAFQQKHGAVVVKPLHGNGGKAIFKVDVDGTNLSAITELFGTVWPEPFMVQPFLPGVAEGDKRIVLVDGEFAGAINRKPGEGEFRSNLAQGGYAEAADLTAREEEICAAMGPELKQRGLVFVGIDVIGGRWQTEINVTSPTRIVAIDAFYGTDTGARIWDAIEGRLAGYATARTFRRPVHCNAHAGFHLRGDHPRRLPGDRDPHGDREHLPAYPVRSDHGHGRRTGGPRDDGFLAADPGRDRRVDAWQLCLVLGRP